MVREPLTNTLLRISNLPNRSELVAAAFSASCDFEAPGRLLGVLRDSGFRGFDRCQDRQGPLETLATCDWVLKAGSIRGC
jgi:hypothetical protein